ncbi:MAG: Sugar phosphate permease [Verrucomicrobia bacterium]|nr:Sugar phosphate permease [Verrucomicrobiota bacterium]
MLGTGPNFAETSNCPAHHPLTSRILVTTLSVIKTLRSNGWLVVGLLWVTACLNYLDRLMITTMRGSIKEVIPMTEAQFGLLTSVVLLIYGFCSPFAGYFADRFNRSYVIMGSLFTWSLVTWLTAFAKTYDQLLAMRAVLALSQVIAVPASVALVVEYHRGSTRSLASGLLLSGAMAGAALCGLGGWIAEGLGWASSYKTFGLIGIGFSFVLFLLLRDPPVTESVAVNGGSETPPVRLGDAFRSLCSNPSFLVMLGFACVLGVVGWSVIGWMPTYFKEQFNLTQGAAGMSTTLYLNIAALLGMVIGGSWADRWSRTNAQARFKVPIIGLCIAAPAVLLLTNAPSLAFALAGLSIYGMARYFADANLMPMLCLLVDSRYRATSWGLSSFCSAMIGGVGIYAGGLLRDAHVDIGRIFQFAAANLVVSALLLFYVQRRQQNAALKLNPVPVPG